MDAVRMDACWKNVAYLLQHKVKLHNEIMKVIFITLVMVSGYR